MAALLRAGRRPEPLVYRSSYPAWLWALAEAATRDDSVPAGRSQAHLALVDMDDDEL